MTGSKYSEKKTLIMRVRSYFCHLLRLRKGGHSKAYLKYVQSFPVDIRYFFFFSQRSLSCEDTQGLMTLVGAIG